MCEVSCNLGLTNLDSRRLRHTILYGAIDIARSTLGVNPQSHRLRPGEFWALDDISLIETGAGLHPMLTRRENVYISGNILGMSKREIDKKFDSIVDFADIGDFIDSPVKHYSSGM